MVRGIAKFREYFEDFEESYVIIGGTACEIHEEKNAQIPRATKDIDLILIVEALSYDFVVRFWEFVEDGNYASRHMGMNDSSSSKHEYYRFQRPEDARFPYQLELFSRRLDAFHLPDTAHLTPVPTEEDLSSLSAILMSDDYYHFMIEHSQEEEGVHIANLESLICLKCKAYIDMVARREGGEHIDSKEIGKHKKDVFRLLAMLAPSQRFVPAATIRADLSLFVHMVQDDLPNADFMKAVGLGTMTRERLLSLLKECFL